MVKSAYLSCLVFNQVFIPSLYWAMGRGLPSDHQPLGICCNRPRKSFHHWVANCHWKQELPRSNLGPSIVVHIRVHTPILGVGMPSCNKIPSAVIYARNPAAARPFFIYSDCKTPARAMAVSHIASWNATPIVDWRKPAYFDSPIPRWMGPTSQGNDQDLCDATCRHWLNDSSRRRTRPRCP